MKVIDTLLDPNAEKNLTGCEKMIAVYTLRKEGYSWKDVCSGLKVSYKQADNMFGRVHEWISFRGMRIENIEEMGKIFGKFCEDRDVTRLIGLMAANDILSLSELNELDLEKDQINGIGDVYRQVLVNVQTYLRNGAGFKRTIHAVISEYAYELLKKECEDVKESMGKVITRALLFYCGIEDAKKEP